MEKENKPTQKYNTEDTAIRFLEISKALRFQKAKETLFGQSIIRLSYDMGLSEATIKDFMTGNSTDKKMIQGLILSQAQLSPQAQQNFNKALNEIAQEIASTE